MFWLKQTYLFLKILFHEKNNSIVGQVQIDDLEIENEKTNRVSEVIKIPTSTMDLYM